MPKSRFGGHKTDFERMLFNDISLSIIVEVGIPECNKIYLGLLPFIEKSNYFCFVNRSKEGE